MTRIQRMFGSSPSPAYSITLSTIAPVAVIAPVVKKCKKYHAATFPSLTNSSANNCSVQRLLPSGAGEQASWLRRASALWMDTEKMEK